MTYFLYVHLHYKAGKIFLGLVGVCVENFIHKLGFLLKTMTFSDIRLKYLPWMSHGVYSFICLSNDNSNYKTGDLNRKIEVPVKYYNNNCNIQCSQNIVLSVSKALY